MILFFQSTVNKVLAVETAQSFDSNDTGKLGWLFGDAKLVASESIKGWFVGPRREMTTPWSSNAVDITKIMGLKGISRIEEYVNIPSGEAICDPMLERIYDGLDQTIFTNDRKPEPVILVDDIATYNIEAGLALSDDEVEYLDEVSKILERKLTDSEVFGFSQVNSEHCRHKIFNGTFIIDGITMESSLFDLIKKTSKVNPNNIVSAYKDNVAFIKGPRLEQFAPHTGEKPDYYRVKKVFNTVLSLKAETHNFPTTVEPYNGGATGSGGEIRDRLGGGKASVPLAGMSVYMTSYPRTEEGRSWESMLEPRKWLYQTPEQILIKASNGASMYGNHSGQPLICGSLLTFEYTENGKKFAFDKVIMQAGGVGFAKKRDAHKSPPPPYSKIVMLGGDNYRIGMGGGAGSSVNTGQFDSGIELNAIQRSNPNMQNRVANVIRSAAEADINPIVSVHDHGAGGHLNCFSELVESKGGIIDMSKLPIGDPTLSAKEIIGNESQERMGLVVWGKNEQLLRRLAARERSPMYTVGYTTGSGKLVFKQNKDTKPIDLKLEYLFGKPPRTRMEDKTIKETFEPVTYKKFVLQESLENVLLLEAVACKDWLTNKVDRSATGKVARQQCQGRLQLPLSDLGAVALDYRGKAGIAVSVGHAPQAALIDPATGSVLAIAEALTNIVFAPLKEQIKSVSLSANWMWPCHNEGEDARLYKAVTAASDFACALGINIPTGKDSLSMTQKYGDDKVLSPGTVIISAMGEVRDVKKIVSPVLSPDHAQYLFYIDYSFDTMKLGGSAFAQVHSKIGDEAPTVKDPAYFVKAFNATQEAIWQGLIIAGHDISAGGLITTLLEMCFANPEGGLDVNLDELAEKDIVKLLFAENPGVIVQVKEKFAFEKFMQAAGISVACIAQPVEERHIMITKEDVQYLLNINHLRDVWYKSSYLLDMRQSGAGYAGKRFDNYKVQPVVYKFPKDFTGTLEAYGLTANRSERNGIKAAVIREEGTRGERETAYALYLAGFDVKDVHMSDLVTGRETLDAVNLIVFCGGSSFSDVLGPAKGWTADILYNEKAKKAIDRFYSRKDTLSIGINNGCQLMTELEVIYPEHEKKHKIAANDSNKLESGFVTLEIPENNSIMLGSLSGCKLGAWIAHSDGKFDFPYDEKQYHIVAKYNYDAYPANPSGSPWAVAGICSSDGRHLALMPHPERSIFPWQCGYYPAERQNDEITPWIEAFVNARTWIIRNI